MADQPSKEMVEAEALANLIEHESDHLRMMLPSDAEDGLRAQDVSYAQEKLIVKALRALSQARPAAENKRPVAFRVQKTSGFWELFEDELAARDAADARGLIYQGLYVREGSAPAAELDRDNEQFNQGVTHTVELLAKALDVDNWVAGDGSEDYDEDLQQTLINILEVKGLYNSETATFAAPAADRAEIVRKAVEILRHLKNNTGSINARIILEDAIIAIRSLSPEAGKKRTCEYCNGTGIFKSGFSPPERCDWCAGMGDRSKGPPLRDHEAGKKEDGK